MKLKHHYWMRDVFVMVLMLLLTIHFAFADVITQNNLKIQSIYCNDFKDASVYNFASGGSICFNVTNLGTVNAYVNVSTIFYSDNVDITAMWEWKNISHPTDTPVYIQVPWDCSNETNISATCFNDVYNHTIHADNYFIDWKSASAWSINSKKNATSSARSTAYTIGKNNASKLFKFDVSKPFSINSSIKFDIKAFETGNAFITTLDPWWNISLPYRMLINCSNMTAGTPLVINGSNGFILNGDATAQIVWTYCTGTNDTYLYYNNYSSYAVANDTAQIPMDVSVGNGTSFNSDQVYPATYLHVFHFDESSGSTVKNSKNYLFNGVAIGTTITTAEAVSGNARKFNGLQNNYINTSISLPDSTIYSFLYWQKGDQPHVAGVYRSVFSSKQSSGFRMEWDGGVPYGYISYYAGISLGAINNINITEKNLLGNYVLIMNQTQLSVYVNKSLKDVNTYSNIGANWFTSLRIGYGYENANIRTWNGTIDEFMIINGSVTEQHINNSYNNYINLQGFGTLGAEEINNTAPSMSAISYTPGTVYTNTDLFTYSVYSDTEADVGNVYWLFFVNDSVVDNKTNTSVGDGVNVSVSFNSSLFNKGDNVNITVNADDGTVNGTLINSNYIIINNSLPSLSFSRSPASVYTNTSILWTMNYSDADSDSLNTSFNITVNGVSVSNGWNSSNDFTLNLSSIAFSKGDVVNLSLNCSDGEDVLFNISSYTVLNTLPVTTALFMLNERDVLSLLNWSWSDVDLDTVNVSLNVNGTLYDPGVNSTSYNITALLKNVLYYWNVTVSDDGFVNNVSSSTYWFIYSDNPATGGSGGGGGGGGSVDPASAFNFSIEPGSVSDFIFIPPWGGDRVWEYRFISNLAVSDCYSPVLKCGVYSNGLAYVRFSFNSSSPDLDSFVRFFSLDNQEVLVPVKVSVFDLGKALKFKSLSVAGDGFGGLVSVDEGGNVNGVKLWFLMLVFAVVMLLLLGGRRR